MTTRNILVALSSLLFAAGCAYQRDGYSYSSTPLHGSEALTAQRAADRSLEDSCRYQINRYGDLAADSSNIQITCRSGAATLSGTVPNERDKEMMEVCVRNTSGVASVDNQLVVSYAPTGTYSQSTVYTPAPPAPVYSPPPPAASVQVQAATDADRDCAQRVIDTIRSDPAFTSQAPTVTVTLNGGRAFIYGTAESRIQRRAIVDAVKRVPGVVDVRDDIRIR